MIKFIWAQDEKGLIGSGDNLPWSNKAEMSYFKNQTTGGIVVMGYKTWKSIGEKPLKNRVNIVLTRNQHPELWDIENLYVANDVNEVLDFYELEDKDLWVIGGAQTYKAFLPYCEEAVVSVVEGDYTGDTYFTELTDKLTKENTVVVSKGDGFTVTHYKVK